MPNWVKVLKTDLLDVVGSECTTTRELALGVGSKLKESISVDALFNAHKRHKDKLSLRSSLMDYMGKEEKAPNVGLNDIRWKLSSEKKAEIKSAERFIITSSMNNCEIDSRFWKSLQRYAKTNKACLLVVPSRYKNPTSQGETSNQKDDYWWPDEVQKHMTDDMVKLHKNLLLMAQVRVGATAVNPLTGLEALSGGASSIFGHSQIAMKTVPTPQHHLPKAMWTTGSCSVPNYSDTKAGIKGEFHHNMGALVVERDGSRFHCRTVTADVDGGFYDLNYYYGPNKVEKNSRVLAIVTGDEHAMFSDSKNKAATYTNKDSIVNTLKPEKIVRHDVFDGYSISHHNRHDPVIQYSKHKNGHHLVKDELELTVKYIDETTPKFAENLIVASNHHDHLLRWLKESHPAQEPWNADVWLEIWGLLKDTIEFKERGVVYKDPFALWMKSRLKSKAKFLSRDAEDSIGGVMIGFHGDQGSNGSRGSINQYAKFGAKTVIGHSHSPGIKHGAYQTGTSSTLRMDYTSGPSSWAHCHCVIYPNGKRQLIFVIDGHWRA
jgi:hypothetical protein